MTLGFIGTLLTSGAVWMMGSDLDTLGVILAIALIGYALAAPVRRQQVVVPLEPEAAPGTVPAG